MISTIVACKTLEDELNDAIRKTGKTYPIEWLESGLHNTPKILRTRLEEILAGIEADRVYVAMGFCGNSIEGVRSGNFELVIPRVDDCISLLIGSVKRRVEISNRYAAYFLTEGWMRGERNLWVEYEYTVNKYGKEMALSIAESLYGHYRTLGILDSGVGDLEGLLEKTKIIAETLKLEQQVIPASTTYLCRLLQGPWPEDMFLIKKPGEAITLKDLSIQSQTDGGN